ncbi:MAG: hypothetical protein ABIQ16_23070, partial [Polyangiaceae bacterium]
MAGKKALGRGDGSILTATALCLASGVAFGAPSAAGAIPDFQPAPVAASSQVFHCAPAAERL